ncbi:MAG: TAXI family TRAP transporter solute-binding subunit [Bacteroidales bacterium]
MGPTGWEVNRPAVAGACEAGCPWGELADFVQESMAAHGYSVVICRNCNRWHGPRLVSEGALPPMLDEANLEDGTVYRINAPVDFGITSSAFLTTAYRGEFMGGGPYKNLRLIAKIEDPFYFLIAVKRNRDPTMAQIREQNMPVRLVDTDGSLALVLDYYGISPQDIEAWGGTLRVTRDEMNRGEFDVLCGFLASPSNNLESSYWTALSEKFDLRFLELPGDLLDRIAQQNVDAEPVVAQHGLLRGLDRRLPTLGRSGEAVFSGTTPPNRPPTTWRRPWTKTGLPSNGSSGSTPMIRTPSGKTSAFPSTRERNATTGRWDI